MRIRIKHVRVIKVDEHKNKIWRSGTGENAVFDTPSIGWGVLLEGSYESLMVGMEKPNIKPGDFVTVILEKEPK